MHNKLRANKNGFRTAVETPKQRTSLTAELSAKSKKDNEENLRKISNLTLEDEKEKRAKSDSSFDRDSSSGEVEELKRSPKKEQRKPSAAARPPIKPGSQLVFQPMR